MRQKRRRRRRRHRINRCVLKPTREQETRAYREFWSVIKQHMAFIEYKGDFDGLRSELSVLGMLEVLWLQFATYEVRLAVIESMRGRVFALENSAKYRRYLISGFVYNAWGNSREKAKKTCNYKHWARTERKYLRWVRRHF